MSCEGIALGLIFCFFFLWLCSLTIRVDLACKKIDGLERRRRIDELNR